MPRYFFHFVLEDGRLMEDVDGEAFPILQEARAHAIRVAYELARNKDPDAVRGRCIAVTEEGGVVFNAPL